MLSLPPSRSGASLLAGALALAGAAAQARTAGRAARGGGAHSGARRGGCCLTWSCPSQRFALSADVNCRCFLTVLYHVDEVPITSFLSIFIMKRC